MSKANVSLYIDQYHPQQEGKCAISIRVTCQRKRKYYPVGISITPNEFNQVLKGKRKDENQKKLYSKLIAFLNKAISAVNNIPIFTFDKFEEIYLENRQATEIVYDGFTDFIEDLVHEERIGNAISYRCARNALGRFNRDLRFADLTPSLLKKFEAWMLSEGNSITTVGIYLRSLRTIVNRTAIAKELNPFGSGKGKYIIPTGKNIKKALNTQELALLFQYQPPEASTTAMAKDYWIFLYLCNGMNVKDFCLLKWSEIHDNTITFQRAKTKRSKRQAQLVTVSLKGYAKEVIDKWGIRNLSKDSYVFPHLNSSMSAIQQHQTIHQLTKTINKYMKRIALELGISKPVTTYTARHSFATILKNSGASNQFISEALAHSDPKTTLNYLNSFEEESIHKTTDALTSFL